MTSADERIPDPPDSPVEKFLSQPAFHADEDAEQMVTRPEYGVENVHHGDLSAWRRFSRWFAHFMFEKDASQYSSMAPRSPDGTRSKIFFNGNGRGR